MSFLKKFKRSKDIDTINDVNTPAQSYSNPDGKKKRLSKRAKIYIGVAAIVVIILGGLVFASSKGFFGKQPEPTIQTYVVPENEKVYIDGLIAPKQTQEFFGPADGQNPEMKVTDGQKVKKGDVLFITKNEAVISQVDDLKAQLDQLKLQKKNIKSDDPAYSALVSEANSQISRVKSQISKLQSKTQTKTLAGFNGKVYLNNSQNVSDGAKGSGPLVTVQSTDYQMVGKVSEQDLEKIHIDKTADVLILSSGKKLTGRVSNIADRPISQQAVDAADGGQPGQSGLSYYQVVVTFDSQEDLVNGFHVQASIEVDNETQRVPSSAVISEDDSSYVFKEVEGVLKKEEVTVDEDKGDFSIVRGNIKPEDIIVKNPNPDMHEGDLVDPDGTGSDSSKKDKDKNPEDMNVEDLDSKEN